MAMEGVVGAGAIERPMQQRHGLAKRRIPLQNMEEVADQRFAVLGSVHAIDGQLWGFGAVEIGVVVVGGFALPLGGGIDRGRRVGTRQCCDAVGLGRQDGGRGHGFEGLEG